MNLLDQQTMQSYIKNGYVTMQPSLSPEIHQEIYQQTERVFEAGNPGNDIFPLVAGLKQVVTHPSVTGALASILGPDYVMHPHRHCHLNLPGTPAQDVHQDSYEDDENVRFHRTRWAMAFYYPQDVTVAMGPTGVQPGSQYYYQAKTVQDMPEVALSGPAGTFTIVHYDLWHGALKNDSDKKRYMVKFLFCRMSEPKTERPTNGSQLDNLEQWHIDKNKGLSGYEHDAALETLLDQVQHGPEKSRLEATYAIAKYGEMAVPGLIQILENEAKERGDQNLAQGYTNPSQLYSACALSNIGSVAVPAVTEALQNTHHWVRAAAAAVLTDTGRAASGAVPKLIIGLSDDNMWVRRNATEALGTIQTDHPDAVDALCVRLRNDEAYRVRHNAALALARLGARAARAVPALIQALNDENLYVRGNAVIALKRINTRQARQALTHVPHLSDGGYHASAPPT